jgi:hypothetical protein
METKFRVGQIVRLNRRYHTSVEGKLVRILELNFNSNYPIRAEIYTPLDQNYLFKEDEVEEVSILEMVEYFLDGNQIP